MVLLAVLAAGATACSTVRETQPERTATEQLLISTAADKAVRKLELDFNRRRKIWFDASRFEAYDEGYALGTIRTRLLTHGARLVPKRGQAEAVVEVRSGALSINKSSDLVGLPQIGIPVPLSGTLELPEVALLKRSEQIGVAKLALTIYDAETGAFIHKAGPAYGLSWRDRWSVLGVGWTQGDVEPEERLSHAGPRIRDRNRRNRADRTQPMR